MSLEKENSSKGKALEEGERERPRGRERESIAHALRDSASVSRYRDKQSRVGIQRFRPYRGGDERDTLR